MSALERVHPSPWRMCLRHWSDRVHASLQTRTVAVVVMVSLALAIVFSLVSMISVRSTLIEQVSTESRDDFSNQVSQARTSLTSADVTVDAQYQGLVNDLASSIQRDGNSNLVGVYIWSKDTASKPIIPISTEPTYVDLISDEMRDHVSADTASRIMYQAVVLPDVTNSATGAVQGAPGAVLGTSLDAGDSRNIQLFTLYSYQQQQSSLAQIQASLLVVCIVLSVMMGLLVWRVLHGITRPIERVADAAERLAGGDLSTRVQVDRHDELGTLQWSFNEMAASLNEKIDQLEQAGVSQRRFVSDVSHELRTPITTMRMASDLLESHKRAFEPTTRRTVELLNEQINRFQDLLVDLLEISRYDAGYAGVNLVGTDLRTTVSAAIDEVRALAMIKHIDLRVDMPPTPVLAKVDVRRITRVIRNLLSNAIDFSQTQPVQIGLVANRDAVVISVRDHGIGMDSDQVTHVFDRFWRADPSRSRMTGGTGLGLSIAQADVLLHRGMIQVGSRVGAGTWFLVCLPRDPQRGDIQESDLPVRFAASTDELKLETVADSLTKEGGSA